MGHIRIAVAALILVTNAVTADCAEIKVVSTPTMKSALEDLAPAFTRATGHTLILTFEGVPLLKRQIEAGEMFDAAILLPAAVDDLTKQGKIAAGTRVDIARTAAGVAIRTGVGIEGEVKPKLLAVAGRSPVEAVARGEAELTVITVPNIIGVEGVALAGLLPDELQNYTTFSIGLSANAKEPAAAQQLVAFLRSPAASAAIRSKGLEPIAP